MTSPDKQKADELTELNKFVHWVNTGFFLTHRGFKYRGGLGNKQKPITLDGLKDIFLNQQP